MRKIKKCEKFVNGTLLSKRFEAAYTTIAGEGNAKNMKKTEKFHVCAFVAYILQALYNGK